MGMDLSLDSKGNKAPLHFLEKTDYFWMGMGHHSVLKGSEYFLMGMSNFSWSQSPLHSNGIELVSNGNESHSKLERVIFYLLENGNVPPPHAKGI